MNILKLGIPIFFMLLSFLPIQVQYDGDQLFDESILHEVRITVPLDIVINEIGASNDSLSGITDPAGGAADWIELYNNTSTDVSLNGFYLSNDKDVLRHWRFPENAMIPANDYLIIWADRDINEEGLHTDFKLSKKKGELYLSFENGDIIDEVSFADQITNVGLARVPNGVGAFTLQQTTFNSTNNVTATTDLSTETSLSIFPNPMHHTASILLHSSRTRSALIQVVDLYGTVLWQERVQANEGVNHYSLPSKRFATGLYSLVLVDENNEERINERLVVVE